MDNETPALSPSTANALATECAREAWLRHRLLGGEPKPPTRPMQLGNLYESLLGIGEHDIEVCPYKDFKKAVAREHRDEAIAAGKIPIVEEKYEEAREVAAILAEKIPEKLGFELTDGETQRKLEWTERSEHGDVLIHAVPDWIRWERGVIVDLKVTEGTVRKEACAKKLLDMGGAIQGVVYPRGVEVLKPELAGRTDMIFCFVQIKPPFCVTPGRLTAAMREVGAVYWEQAMNTFARCLKAGREMEHWPEHVDGICEFDAPGWLVQRVLYEGEDE